MVAGTGGGSGNWYKPGGFSFHEGESADDRMMQVAAARGVTLTSRSRPLNREDLHKFDVIVGMDSSNVTAIKEAARFWGAEFATLADAKTVPISNYFGPKFSSHKKVPDPYYGSGSSGFELVLDMLEDACERLMHDLL
mmetsp:Transcript_14993/g.32558  ORF Transcript_14993/g.32558 Transcript_14993/m.32558 type:complete len:138 (+) Transcript_14993:159-572(+)